MQTPEMMFTFEPPLESEPIDTSRIIGHTLRSPVTLDGCIQGDVTVAGDTKKITYRSNYTYFGHRYSKNEEISFYGMGFSVEELDQWLWISGIESERDIENNTLSINYRQPDDITVNLNDDTELRFGFDMQLSNSNLPVTESTIIQSSYINFICNKPESIEYFQNKAFQLCNFLSLALDASLTICSMVGYSSPRQNDSNFRESVRVYFQGNTQSEILPTVYRHNVLFQYPDISDRLDSVLKKWLEYYESLETAFNLYFLASSRVIHYVDVKFLWLTQALEIFYRDGFQKGSNHGYKKMIKMISEPLLSCFCSNTDIDEFSAKAAHTRHYLTHHNLKRASKKVDDRELFPLKLKLQAILKLHMLRLVGIDTESLIKHNSQLRHQLNL